MRKRFTKIAAALAALAALALGGAALSSAGQGGTAPVKPAQAEQQGTENAGAGKVDTDSIQDQSGAADATEPAGVEENGGSGKADTDSIQDEKGSDNAGEPAESSSEVQGNDGPGGHADEPADPNADHQFEGQE